MVTAGCVELYVLACSQCRQPTVSSSLCERPDLCYRCFAEAVAGELP